MLDWLAIIDENILKKSKRVFRSWWSTILPECGYVLADPCYQAFQYYNISTKLDELCNSMQIAIGLVIEKVGDIPDQLSDAQNVMNNTVQPIMQSVFWWYIGIVLIILFLFLVVFFCCKSKKLLTVMIVLTEVVVIILSIVYVVELYAVRLTSAFCYPDPSTNVLNQISINSSIYHTAEFYTTCNGK